MKFSSIVPLQDLQNESGLGALDFEVAVSAVSNSKSEKPKMVKPRKVHDWKVCCHQWPCCCCKKIWVKEPTSQLKYRERVLYHVQSRARESQKRKMFHCAKSKYFTERASTFVGEFRSNGPKVFIGSLK